MGDNRPSFQLQKIKEYVLGICKPFFENYKRIIGYKINFLDDRIQEIEETGLVILSENIEDLTERVVILEDTTIPELEDQIILIKNTTIPDLTERVIIIEDENIPNLNQAVNGLASQMTTIRNVNIPNTDNKLNNHEQRIITIEDDHLPEIFSRVRNNKTELDNIKTDIIPILRNDLQTQITSNDDDINSLKDRANISENRISIIEDTTIPTLQESLQDQITSNDNQIADILTVLTTDDTALDEFQEIVNFIKQNKHILDTLGISNIAGLETALQELQAQITSNDDDISGLQSASNTHTKKLANIEGTVLPNLQLQIDGNDQELLTILSMLASDDTTLDTLQKVVDYIKSTRLQLYTQKGRIDNILATDIPDIRNNISINSEYIDYIQKTLISNDTTLNTLQKIIDYIKLTRTRADDARTRISRIEGSKYLLHPTDPLRIIDNYIYLYKADGSYDKIKVNSGSTSHSFEANGYIELFDEFIIQWGTQVPGEDYWRTFNLPLTFTNNGLAIVASGKDGRFGSDTDIQARIISPSQYQLVGNAYAKKYNYYVNWIAVGY